MGEGEQRGQSRGVLSNLGAEVYGALVALAVGGAWAWLSDRWSAGSLVLLAVAIILTVVVALLLAGRSLMLAATFVALVALVTVGVVVVVDDGGAPAAVARDDCGRHVRSGAPEVVVVWEEEELADFCAVLAEYGPNVEVTSVGEGIRQALTARVADDDLPDVAIVPQPSLVQLEVDNGRLCPIDPEVRERMPEQWLEMVTGSEPGNGPRYPYGAFVKGVDKSLFWYGSGTIAGQEPESWTWHDLDAWVTASLDGGSGVAPLTVPAANRWILTDWFENQLADLAPDLYRRLAAGEDPEWGASDDHDRLVDTLGTMADMWSRPGVFASEPGPPADTSWREVGRQLADGDAQLAFAPSFAAGTFGDLPDDTDLRPIAFPGQVSGHGPSVVGGDIAVVPKQGGKCNETTDGRALVEWLTDVDAMRAWARHDPGYLTPNLLSPLRPGADPPADPADNVRVLLTLRLQHPPGGRLFFDLSDDRFAVANHGDTTATWNILGDFFTEVTTGEVSRACAIDRVITRLAHAYRGEDPTDTRCDE